MGIELDLFCLNANYPRSDRLRSSVPSNSFASALPGWRFYLEDLHWGKAGKGSELPVSRAFAAGLWCSQCKSLWSQDLWTEWRVYHQLALCGVQVHWVSVSLYWLQLQQVSCKGEGVFQACLPLLLMIWNVLLKGPAATVPSSREKLHFH